MAIREKWSQGCVIWKQGICAANRGILLDKGYEFKPDFDDNEYYSRKFGPLIYTISWDPEEDDN